VVAHNTLIRLVLCHLLGVPLAEYRIRFPSLHNCALNEIRIPPTGSATLLRYNAMLSEDSPRVSR
jgi:probable phosphoglycerate mutase